MILGAPKELGQLRRFFLEPLLPKHRQYEALRAFLVEGRPAKEVARAFGYTLNSFQCPLSSFPPRIPTRLLFGPASRPPDPTQEVGRAGPYRPTAQAEPFRL